MEGDFFNQTGSKCHAAAARFNLEMSRLDSGGVHDAPSPALRRWLLMGGKRAPGKAAYRVRFPIPGKIVMPSYGSAIPLLPVFNPSR